MSELRAAIARVKEDAGAARAYFHTWWGLRSLALPQFHSTLNNYTYVDFFHAANSGFLKLTFVSLAKLFDRDDRALGFSRLREVLAASGRVDDSTFLQERLAPH